MEVAADVGRRPGDEVGKVGIAGPVDALVVAARGGYAPSRGPGGKGSCEEEEEEEGGQYGTASLHAGLLSLKKPIRTSK